MELYTSENFHKFNGVRGSWKEEGCKRHDWLRAALPNLGDQVRSDPPLGKMTPKEASSSPPPLRCLNHCRTHNTAERSHEFLAISHNPPTKDAQELTLSSPLPGLSPQIIMLCQRLRSVCQVPSTGFGPWIRRQGRLDPCSLELVRQQNASTSNEFGEKL